MTYDKNTIQFLPKPTKSSFKDMQDQTFDRLKVLGYAGSQTEKSLWFCECECGRIKKVQRSSLISGKTQSCGCLNIEIRAAVQTTHGQCGTLTYRIWQGIKTRCYRKNATHYDRYGGRGIQVCDRWRNSFENFFADMGECPEGWSIERKDNDGDYTPENCCWATVGAQRNNMSSNVFYTMDGKTQTIAQWAKEYGLNYHKTYCRLRVSGWDLERALFT